MPRTSVVVRTQVPSWRGGRGGFGFEFGGREFRHHHFRYPLIYPYGYGYPYYGAYSFYDPGYYGGYYSNYSNYDSNDYSQQQQLQLSNEVSSLDQQMRQLRDENDELRDYVARHNNSTQWPDRSIPPSMKQPLQPDSPVASRPTQGPATVLAYRDGRRVEARNYAIVGETLWVLSGERALKIPLSELDLDKTIQENEQRGVEFTAPK